MPPTGGRFRNRWRGSRDRAPGARRSPRHTPASPMSPAATSGEAPPRRLKWSRSQAIVSSSDVVERAPVELLQRGGLGVPGGPYRTSKSRSALGIRQAAQQIGVHQHGDGPQSARPILSVPTATAVKPRSRARVRTACRTSDMKALLHGSSLEALRQAARSDDDAAAGVDERRATRAAVAPVPAVRRRRCRLPFRRERWRRTRDGNPRMQSHQRADRGAAERGPRPRRVASRPDLRRHRAGGGRARAPTSAARRGARAGPAGVMLK